MKVFKDSRKKTGILDATLFWIGISTALVMLYICHITSRIWEQIKRKFL